MGPALQLVLDRLPDPLGIIARQHAADADEDDDVSEVPEKAGLGEENNEDHKSSKKGFFPSSMGISFLISMEVGALDVAVSWGDYTPDEVEGDDGKTTASLAAHAQERDR